MKGDVDHLHISTYLFAIDPSVIDPDPSGTSSDSTTDAPPTDFAIDLP